MMRSARAPTPIDALEPMVDVYVDEDDYTIECDELGDTGALVAGMGLRQGAED